MIGPNDSSLAMNMSSVTPVNTVGYRNSPNEKYKSKSTQHAASSGVFRNGGGHIDGHKKFDDLFWEANICRPFLGERPTWRPFFYSLSPILSPRSVQRGAIRPSTCLQALQKIFPSAKGGPWHNGPPKYATGSSPPLSSPPSPLSLQPPDGSDVQSARGVGAYSRGVQPPDPPHSLLSFLRSTVVLKLANFLHLFLMV
jgi:hypothetical protein